VLSMHGSRDGMVSEKLEKLGARVKEVEGGGLGVMGIDTTRMRTTKIYSKRMSAIAVEREP